MKKVNWKGNLIALGITVGVFGSVGYLSYINTHTTYDTSKITATQNDNSPNIVTEDVNGNIHSVDNESPFVNDSYMNTPVENSDDSTSIETNKPEPKVGMFWQDIKNTSWGEPEDKTVTKDKYGSSELWIYSGGRSLFFEDGVLESITQ